MARERWPPQRDERHCGKAGTKQYGAGRTDSLEERRRRGGAGLH
jgi:hypothetical protein